MSELAAAATVIHDISPAKAWLRALELTAPIPRNPNRVISVAIEEMAARCSEAPALMSARECFTFGELLARANRYARWALDQGLKKGDVVALVMTSRPEYFAIWLGITSVGGVVALLNTNLGGPSLAHCVNIVRPGNIIVSDEFAGELTAITSSLIGSPTIWTHRVEFAAHPRIDVEIQNYCGEELRGSERPKVGIEDRALYIFTSGTTGLPKAVNISHARVMQWSLWFAGMMGAEASDRMYSCLPMYHSIGGVLVPGAILLSGASAVIREKFSASQFWSDIDRWDCTMFQYIGEFCRYLLHGPSPNRSHRIRLACGNGLAPDVWDEFKDRFDIPRILEFYASTEGGVSLFNAEEKRGAIGRVPPYLTHRFSPTLVQFDFEKGMPVRDSEGFCVRCGLNEAGEALARLTNDPSQIGSRFEGYTDEAASESKILRNVFKAGDAWVRTGDLMRKDEKGFFYFVDRIGDTFRWKGENVATSEVSAAICEFPGIKHANVYGVAVPANDGRAGMAAVVAASPLDLSGLWIHLENRLPFYARPLFLRLQHDAEITGTFKYSKTELVRQGYDPAANGDVIYFSNPESNRFEQVDEALYKRIQGGGIRL